MSSPYRDVQRINRKSLSMVVIVIGLICCMIVGFPRHEAAALTTSPYGVYVQDEADQLSGSVEEQLYERAIWLKEQTTTAQIGLVTVKSLEGMTLEELATARFREMGLGDKDRDDGILLLYSAADGHVRMEVGYGLEGRINDGKAGAILDQYFVPSRDAGNLDEAFSQTQSALIKEIAAEYNIAVSEDALARIDPIWDELNITPEEKSDFWNSRPAKIMKIIFVVVILLWAMINGFGGKGGKRNGGGRSSFGGGSSGGRSSSSSRSNGRSSGGRGGGGSSGGGGASR